MDKAEFAGRQQKSTTVQMGRKESVVAAFPINSVPHNGVGDVFHVAPQLVAAAGFGRQRHKGVAGGGVSVNIKGQFHPGNAGVIRDGPITLQGLNGLFVGRGVFDVSKGVNDGSSPFNMAPDHGAVGLLNFTCLEQAGQLCCHVTIPCKHKHTLGGPVQPVYRKNMPLGLIPYHLQGESGFTGCKGASVHQQTRGFVYGNNIRVLVEDFKGARGIDPWRGFQNRGRVSRRLLRITVPG